VLMAVAVVVQDDPGTDAQLGVAAREARQEN
jgi:hypothetical protein